MLALIGCVVAVLAAFNVHIGDVQLGWIAVAFIAAHFVLRDGLAPVSTWTTPRQP